MIKSKIIRQLLLSCAMLGLIAGTANATSLLLPPANEITVGQYGDFSVYSLDLLQVCAAAGDSRCLPSGPYPVQSSPGQINDQLIIYKTSNGNTMGNYDSTGPFAGQSPATVKVDDPFDSSTGVGATFDMSSGNEPATTWTGGTDVNGRWDASLSSVLSYLTNPDGTVNDLVFLFDNNQQGTALTQQQFLWGQIRILDATGNETGICYELNSTGNACIGGSNPNPSYAGVTTTGYSGDYVSTVGQFCVDATTGASYNFGAANSSACNPGDYFVNNNLGQSNAEFAAYVAELNNNLVQWAALGYSMSVNFKMRNLNDGGEQLWIGSNVQLREVPEPVSMILFGTGLAGLAGLRIRRKK